MEYAIEISLCSYDKHIMFHEDWYRHPSIIKICEAIMLVSLMEGFINYALEMESSSMMCILSLIKPGSGIQKLIVGICMQDS
jgi:hypothetical protein